MDQVTSFDVFGNASVALLADAAVAGDKPAIAAMARSGVDASARGDRGVSVLQWAFLHQSIEGMTGLLAAGADPASGDDHGNTVMDYASAAENPAALAALLGAGVDPDTRNARTGQTALFTAIMHARQPQIRALVAAGADVDATDLAGNTPLHHAAKVNDVAVVLLLLEAGADPLRVNGQGVTFQRYLSAMDDTMRTRGLRELKERVDALLRERGVPVHSGH